MRLSLFISLLSIGLSLQAQIMTLPTTLINHGRSNIFQVIQFNSAIGEDGNKLFMHADLKNFGYSSMKLSTDYYHFNELSSFQDNHRWRLKFNYKMAITRKISLAASASAGISFAPTNKFIYSGGITYLSRRLSLNYHLFGETGTIVHSFQMQTDNFALTNTESKYADHLTLSFEGHYAINDSEVFSLSNNYLKATFKYQHINGSLGLYEKNSNFQPYIGIRVVDIGHLSFGANLYFESKEIPSLQFHITYKRMNLKRRTFINIGTPNF